MADIKITGTVRLHKDDSSYFIDATLDAWPLNFLALDS
jgi:hypothetical protein